MVEQQFATVQFKQLIYKTGKTFQQNRSHVISVQFPSLLLHLLTSTHCVFLASPHVHACTCTHVNRTPAHKRVLPIREWTRQTAPPMPRLPSSIYTPGITCFYLYFPFFFAHSFPCHCNDFLKSFEEMFDVLISVLFLSSSLPTCYTVLHQ